MINNTFVAVFTFVGLLVVFFAGSSPVLAETKVDTIERVDVVAPRVKVESALSGVSTLYTAKRDARVKLDDLDLTSTADRQRLEDRVNEAANRVCQELKDDLPFGQPETPVCVYRVVNKALAQVDEAT